MRNGLFAFIVLAVLFPWTTCAKEPFTIGFSRETTCKATELENTLTEAYARAGYSVRFEYAPRLRAYQEANLGDTDAIAVCSKGALSTYPNLHILPTPLAQVVISAISHDPTVVIKKLEDLKHHTVGVLRGQLLAVNMAKEHAKRISEVNTLDNLLGMLEHGRVDVALLNRDSTRAILVEKGPHPYKESKPLLTSYLFHAVNRTSLTEEQAARIDKALLEMIKDGTMKKLYGRLDEMVPTLPLHKNR